MQTGFSRDLSMNSALINHDVLARGEEEVHVSVEKDEAGLYVGRCKELPGAFTQARSVTELKQRMAEAISLIMEDIEEEHSKNPEKIIEVVV